MVAGWEVSMEESMKGMVPNMARSIAGKKLPPIPAEAQKVDAYGKLPTSIMLFYQYVEPAWTPKQHRRALTFVRTSEDVDMLKTVAEKLVLGARSWSKTWYLAWKT